MKTVTFSNEGHGNVGRVLAVGSYLFINFFPNSGIIVAYNRWKCWNFLSVLFECRLCRCGKEKLRDTIESNF